jgi:hypothetical protein
MNTTILLLIAFIVAVIVGPFATLYAVSSWRRRRDAAPLRPVADDDDDESSGF